MCSQNPDLYLLAQMLIHSYRFPNSKIKKLFLQSPYDPTILAALDYVLP